MRLDGMPVGSSGCSDGPNRSMLREAEPFWFVCINVHHGSR